MVQEETEVLQTVSNAVNRLVRKGRNAEYTFGNGIVLRIKPVPPYLINAVMAEFPDPEPPMWLNPEKDREEPNPSDPGYLKQIVDNEAKKDLAINDLVLAVGTEFVSAPEGMFAPSDEEWLKNLEIVTKVTGKTLEINRDDETQRYIAWLRFYALEDSTDVAIAQTLSFNLIGVQEGEVAKILAGFQGGPASGTDSDAASPGGSENGNQPNRAARRSRPRNRGAGSS